MNETDSSARNWAALCHASALVFFLGVPLGNVLGPLVVWLFRRNDHPYVDSQGKEALNFQISFTVYIMASILLMGMLGLSFIPFFWPFQPSRHMWAFWDVMAMPLAFLSFIVLMMGLILLDLVLTIMAAYKASNGEDYRYPLSIRLVS
ncbi:MAG: DUF4870 domain-containing protein [Methanotrichaceae archaeon]|nr:DUF4870 domain-containing protein [Methanotrichaceae archaeon]